MGTQALAPLRRRGSEDRRIRRIKKWWRRGHVGMIRRHFPSAWRFYLRAVAVDSVYITLGVLTPEEVRQSRFSGTWVPRRP